MIALMMMFLLLPKTSATMLCRTSFWWQLPLHSLFATHSCGSKQRSFSRRPVMLSSLQSLESSPQSLQPLQSPQRPLAQLAQPTSLQENPHHQSAANPSAPVSLTSDRVLHVSNLDWFVTQEAITVMLQQCLTHSQEQQQQQQQSLETDLNNNNNSNSHWKHAEKTFDCITFDYITFKEISTLRPKRRDVGKFHAGSATLHFATPQQAQWAFQCLQTVTQEQQQQQQQQSSLSSSPTSTSKFQVRWAPLYNPFDKSGKSLTTTINRDSDGGTTATTTDDDPFQLARLQAHRQARAARYARRRRRIAQSTDEIVATVLASFPAARLCHAGHNDPDVDIGMDEDDVLMAPAFTTTWHHCPLDPVKDGLGIGSRGIRKRAAVEAFYHVVQNMLGVETLHQQNTDKDSNCKHTSSSSSSKHDQEQTAVIQTMIADLGSGSGHLTLPLAWWLQQQQQPWTSRRFTILAVDRKVESLHRLVQRAESAKLAVNEDGATVKTLCADLQELIASNSSMVSSSSSQSLDASQSQVLANCEAIVSLHACGSASDLAIAAAVSHNLPFAVSPCCIGKIGQDGDLIYNDTAVLDDNSSGIAKIKYPRSHWLRQILQKRQEDVPTTEQNNDKSVTLEDNEMDSSTTNDLILADYELLAKAADYGVNYTIPVAGEVSSFGQYLMASQAPVLHSTMHNDEVARRVRCQQAKRIVEMDRLQWAAETKGYTVRLLELPRVGPLYPKRQLLLGAPAQSRAALAILNLATVSKDQASTMGY